METGLKLRTARVETSSNSLGHHAGLYRSTPEQDEGCSKKKEKTMERLTHAQRRHSTETRHDDSTHGILVVIQCP